MHGTPARSHSSAQIAAAYRKACLAELDALKPGNVHRWRSGHRMEVADFERSADVTAPIVAAVGTPVGARIRRSVEATFAAVGMNTNLGILLLCAPIAAAAESVTSLRPAQGYADILRQSLRAILGALGPDDASEAFAAIAIASPGGLGKETEHDVRAPTSIGLVEAMRIASARDAIGAQYASGFEDVFRIGLPALVAAKAGGEKGMWPTIRCFLAFATRLPDSHVGRKHGPLAAHALMERMRELDKILNSHAFSRDREAALQALDADLKDAGINPGTTADLTVATLFVEALAQMYEE